MVNATHKSYKASDRSYYSIIKKELHNLAAAAGFSEKKTADLDIIIAEITSNLQKYADGGEILMGLFEGNDNNSYIELICLDEGPGMADASKMLADGFSSTNTMGHGLGSIKRLADRFDIYSLKGWGTILLCRLYKNSEEKLKKFKKNIAIYPVVVSKPGETKSGDGYYYKTIDQHIKLIVADGLGHGPEANFAVNEAVAAFKTCPYNSPVEILRYIHNSIRKTRGMVATVAVFDLETNMMRIAGIGNISAKVFGPNTKNYFSYNGIVGHNIPNTMNDQEMDITDQHQIVFCSDGIRSRWDFLKYNGIAKCDPTIQAAAIYKDFARQNDDMSVVIGKIQLK